jgi:hypothetical protein
MRDSASIAWPFSITRTIWIVAVDLAVIGLIGFLLFRV